MSGLLIFVFVKDYNRKGWIPYVFLNKQRDILILILSLSLSYPYPYPYPILILIHILSLSLSISASTRLVVSTSKPIKFYRQKYQVWTLFWPVVGSYLWSLKKRRAAGAKFFRVCNCGRAWSAESHFIVFPYVSFTFPCFSFAFHCISHRPHHTDREVLG